MGISIPLQLADEMTVVNRETCLNFVYFRNILKFHRSKCDDKIKQRLSSISNLKDQCPKFGENLRKAQESRMKNLKFCMQVLKEQSESIEISKLVLEKEVKLKGVYLCLHTYILRIFRKGYWNRKFLLKKLFVNRAKFYLIINVNLFKEVLN